MSPKVIMDNVIVNAKNGGTITNADVEITNSILNFKENNIEIKNSEALSIIEAIINSGREEDLAKLLSQIKSAGNDESASEIINQSNLKDFFKEVKEWAPIIISLIQAFINA